MQNAIGRRPLRQHHLSAQAVAVDFTQLPDDIATKIGGHGPILSNFAMRYLLQGKNRSKISERAGKIAKIAAGVAGYVSSKPWGNYFPGSEYLQAAAVFGTAYLTDRIVQHFIKKLSRQDEGQHLQQIAKLKKKQKKFQESLLKAKDEQKKKIAFELAQTNLKIVIEQNYIAKNKPTGGAYRLANQKYLDKKAEYTGKKPDIKLAAEHGMAMIAKELKNLKKSIENLENDIAGNPPRPTPAQLFLYKEMLLKLIEEYERSEELRRKLLEKEHIEFNLSKKRTNLLKREKSKISRASNPEKIYTRIKREYENVKFPTYPASTEQKTIPKEQCLQERSPYEVWLIKRFINEYEQQPGKRFIDLDDAMARNLVKKYVLENSELCREEFCRDGIEVKPETFSKEITIFGDEQNAVIQFERGDKLEFQIIGDIDMILRVPRVNKKTGLYSADQADILVIQNGKLVDCNFAPDLDTKTRLNPKTIIKLVDTTKVAQINRLI